MRLTTRLCTSILAACASLSMYSQMVNSTALQYSPNPVTDCQSTTALVSVTKNCTNMALDSIAFNMVTSDTAELKIYYSLGPICLGAIANVTENQGIGILPNTLTQIRVECVLNQSTVHTAYYGINVLSCCAVTSNFSRSASVVCPGDSVTFTNTSANGSIYQWYVDNSPVSNTQNYGYVFSAPGSYVVSLVSSDGSCSDSISKFITVVDASVELGNDTTVCLDGSFVLDAGITRDSVFWSNGSQGRYLPITQAGSYEVIAYRGGCPGYDTIVVNGHPTPSIDLGTDTTLCYGDSLILDASQSFSSTFAWQDSSTASTFTVNAPGLYFVRVTSADGCVGIDSIQVQMDSCSGIGMDQFSVGRLEIYPNPTMGVVMLEMSEVNGPHVVQVIDLSGRKVAEVRAQFEHGKFELDLGVLESGLYFIRLENNGLWTTRPIVVK